MRKKHSWIVFGFCLLFPWLVAAHSKTLHSRHIEVTNPIIGYFMQSNQDSTRAIMQIENNSDQPIVIIAATAPIADQVQLHELDPKSGKLHKVARLVIQPHQAQTKKNTNLHLKLIGLRETLRPNKRIPIQLIFEDGSWLVTSATIRPLPPSAKTANHEHQ